MNPPERRFFREGTEVTRGCSVECLSISGLFVAGGIAPCDTPFGLKIFGSRYLSIEVMVMSASLCVLHSVSQCMIVSYFCFMIRPFTWQDSLQTP